MGSIGNASSGFYINGNSATSGLEFATNTIVPSKNTARIDAALNLGMSTNRFKDLYLSGGVYLGGTGSANLLDDVEEGYWIPTHSGNTMSGSGYYVKIGRLVTIHADTTAPSGSSTTNIITGLPFAAISTHSAASVGYTNSSSQPAGGYTSVSQIHFIKNGTTVAANIAANERLIFSAFYFTDS